MKYYSVSRKLSIDVTDMKTEHLAAALERGTREETLRPPLHRAMIAEYISRTREERQSVNQKLYEEICDLEERVRDLERGY